MKIPEGTLSCIIEDNGVIENASKTIPIIIDKMDVKFYPEGGDLISNLKCGLYFESLTNYGEPADFSGDIIDLNQNFISSVSTVHEGRGKVYFTPSNSQYYLRINKPIGITKLVELPSVKENGISMRSTKDIFECNELIGMKISSTFTGNFYATIFKRDSELSKIKFKISEKFKDQEVWLTLPSSSNGDGVLRILISDSNKKPLSERLIFRKPEKEIKIKITSDYKSYSPGEKASVSVKTTDENDVGVPCFISVIVTDQSVLEMIEKRKQAPRISSMIYLEQEVESLQDSNVYFKDDGESKIDLILGVQGWRRYLFESIENEIGKEDKKDRVFGRSKFYEPSIIYNEIKNETYSKITFGNATTSNDLFGTTNAFSFGENSINPTGFYFSDNSNQSTSKIGQNQNIFGFGSPNDLINSPYSTSQSSFGFGSSNKSSSPFLATKASTGFGNTNNSNFGMSTTIQSSFGTSNNLSSPFLANANSFNQSSFGTSGFGNSKSSNSEFTFGDTTNTKSQDSLFGDSSKGFTQKFSTGNVPNNQISQIFGAPIQPFSKPDPFNQKISNFSFGMTTICPIEKYVHKKKYGSLGERFDFQETLFWSFSIPTNKNGDASFTFDLCDSITSFKIIVDSYTFEGVFGTGERLIQSKEPFFVELKVPNQLTVGDNIFLPVSIMNSSSDVVIASLNPNIDDSFELLKYSNLKINILSEQGKRILVPLKAKYAKKKSSISFSAKSDFYEDKVIRSIDILENGFPITTFFSILIDKNDQIVIPIEVPNGAIEGIIKSSIQIYPSFNSNLKASVNSLIKQPHGCFEQISSTNYPLVLAYKFMSKMKFFDLQQIQKSKKNIQEAYNIMKKFECKTGGN
jgi:alpha-2-macroglobulin-like protein